MARAGKSTTRLAVTALVALAAGLAALAAGSGPGSAQGTPPPVDAFAVVDMPAVADQTPSWGISWGSLREGTGTGRDRFPDLFASHHDRDAQLYEFACAISSLVPDPCAPGATNMNPLMSATKNGQPLDEKLDTHGAAWGDVNNNLSPDLFQATGGSVGGTVAVPRQFNVLYENLIGPFNGSPPRQTCAGQASPPCVPQAELRCMLSDHTAIGHAYPRCRTTGQFANLEEDGSPTAQGAACANPAPPDPIITTSGRTPLWFDADGDSDLDLYMFNRAQPDPANNCNVLTGAQFSRSNLTGGSLTFTEPARLHFGNTAGTDIDTEYGQVFAPGPLHTTTPPAPPPVPCVLAHGSPFPATANTGAPTASGRCGNYTINGDGPGYRGSVSDTAIADFDLDGDLDIYLARSRPRSGAREIPLVTTSPASRYHNTVIAKLRARSGTDIAQDEVLYLRTGTQGPSASGAIVALGPDFVGAGLNVYIADPDPDPDDPDFLPLASPGAVLNPGTGTTTHPGTHCGVPGVPVPRREILDAARNVRYQCLDTNPDPNHPNSRAVGLASDAAIGQHGKGIYIRRDGSLYEIVAYAPPTSIFEANIMVQHVATTPSTSTETDSSHTPDATFTVNARDTDAEPDDPPTLDCTLPGDEITRPACGAFHTSAVQDQLLEQDSTGVFTNDEIPGHMVTNLPQSCHSVTALDVDNDTDTDLYLACTRNVTADTPPVTTLDNVSNILLINDRAGHPDPANWRFHQIQFTNGSYGGIKLGAAVGVGYAPAPLPFTNKGLAEATASADINRDGWIDLALTNGLEGGPFNEGPVQVFRNLLGAAGAHTNNKALAINLQGRYGETNADGIGTTVYVEILGNDGQPLPNHPVLVALQDGGMHRYSQDHDVVHIGLGTLADQSAGHKFRITTRWQDADQTTGPCVHIDTVDVAFTGSVQHLNLVYPTDAPGSPCPPLT